MKRIIIFLSLLLMTSLAFSADKSSLKFRFIYGDTNNTGPISRDCEKISVYENLEKKDYLVEKKITVDGSHIKEIELNKNQFFDVYEIQLTLDEEGRQLFSKLTADNIGRSLLAQIDNYYLFNAVIKQEISSDKVSVSGFSNLAILKKLKERFNCIDNTNLKVDEREFEKSTFASGAAKKTDKKNPIQVMAAFLYFYKEDNPQWKDFIQTSQNEDGKKAIQKLEELRKDFYSSLSDYEVYLPKMKAPVKTPPAVFFNREEFLDVYLPFELVNKENIFIQNINLVVNKKGQYFIRDFN